MRLLEICSPAGASIEFKLTKHENPPPYAILSHRWGEEEDELSFDDIQNITAGMWEKAGYRKVLGFLAQASRHGLKYGWVDTCCIDKKSSAELSEAINSMFQYYQNAQCCYVHLFDFPPLHTIPHIEEDLLDYFKRCQWFSRGWTLQELLAPNMLKFYSQDWGFIGDRDQLSNGVSEVTGIHRSALMGQAEKLRSFSIAQRMSWASKRVTTRVEDIAYCLMGIFDVNMPLLYGEGHKAFTRLQEEIVKSSDDQTIFCWVRTPKLDGMIEETSSVFASSPQDFDQCTAMVPITNGIVQPYDITNAGLRMTGRLHERNNVCHLFMRCFNDYLPHSFITIPLIRLSPGGNVFARISSSIGQDFHEKHASSAQTIYISRKPARLQTHYHVGYRVSVSLKFLLNDYRIVDVFPPYRWNSAEMRLYPTDLDGKSESLNGYSWHAVLNVVFMKVPVLVFVGYDGRRNQAWCYLHLVDAADRTKTIKLVDIWNSYGEICESFDYISRTDLGLWVLQAKVVKQPSIIVQQPNMVARRDAVGTDPSNWILTFW